LQMNEAQVVACQFFPADQQSPRAVGPRMTSFDNPAVRLVATARCFAVLGTGRHMRNVARAPRATINGRAKIAFIETKMLATSALSQRPWDGNRTECRAKECLIVSIRTSDGDADGHAARIGEDGSLDAQLTAIGRIFAGFFPRPAVTWSSPRPDFANANRSRACDDRTASRPSTTCGTRHARPILESNDAPCWVRRTEVARLSTGNRCGVDKRCRQPPPANSHAVALLCGWDDTWAEAVPNVPKVTREHAQTYHANRKTFPPPCQEHETYLQVPTHGKHCGSVMG